MAEMVTSVCLINDFDFVSVNFSVCGENCGEGLAWLSDVSVVYWWAFL